MHVLGYTFKLDRDTAQKFAVAVLSAAATAAFTAGLDKLVALLAADPRYAAFAAIITFAISAFSKKTPAA